MIYIEKGKEPDSLTKYRQDKYPTSTISRDLYSVRTRKIYGFLGKNGAGKTTGESDHA